ncbi:membrane proteins related to metalloendopeptidases [Pseudanabaena sp. lw0831]|uniref:DUF928 domain-containing protein n=1 Tax=Pseudanabaena sp. lw0831 TaxID=1357935 RepID=UPI001915DE9D|nr:DUF928 domain-containing protein [Pseudanabaena sp. lw0831]GBO54469.1 membrane proteins related to metalloendopeptidases [Pseudanabaena sp. lw0831]
MFLPKFASKKILIASACSCLAVVSTVALPLSLSLFTPSAQAQSRRVRYVPPSNLGTPIVSTPGILRSSGCTELVCLIGLVPDLVAETAPVPQTIAERPTFYFLIPATDGQGYFRLYESDSLLKQGKRIYRTSFKIKNKAGILAFKMPDNAPSLKTNKNYIWEFVVGNLTDTERVSGSIRRVVPTQKLTEQLKQVMLPIDRAALFAQEGIWFETMQTLAEAQQGTPKKPEIVSEWNALLKSAKLDRVLPYSFLNGAVASVTSSERTSPPQQNSGY